MDDKTHTLELCFFHGRSVGSRLIECFTWGDISHVAVRDPNEHWVWESLTKHGVEKVPSISTNHKDRTKVDIYALDVTEEQYRKGVEFLDDQVGKRYDFAGIWSFVFRHRFQREGRWFCSELAQAFAQAMGVVLLRCPPYKASPTILSYSTVPRFVRTEYTSRREP